MKTTFVWPYYDGNAHYDELRWSIRSVLKYFRGEAELLVIGDRPKWYSGPMVERPRIGRGKAFATGLNDALTKWHSALNHVQTDSVVWMMDDCFFTKRFSLADLQLPRAVARINPRGSSGFQAAKSRTFQALSEKSLPVWDFASHVPHAVDRKQALQLFDDFKIIERKLLWEVVYRNATLNGLPGPLHPFFRYLSQQLSDVQIKVLASNVTCFNTSKKSWNEPVRRFLFNDLAGFDSLESQKPKSPRQPQRNNQLKDESRWTPWGAGWSAPNGKSPEKEFVDFVSSVVKLHRPGFIIETGMGQGFITKSINAAKPKESVFTTYESDAAFRKKPPVCGCIVSAKESPAVGDIKKADLLVFDSDTRIRLREIELWHKHGKPGSTMIVHDVSDRHGPEKIHTRLLNHIRELGINGSLLRNPRGGFISTKPTER